MQCLVESAAQLQLRGVRHGLGLAEWLRVTAEGWESLGPCTITSAGIYKMISNCCTERLCYEPGSQNNHLSIGKINYWSLWDPHVMVGQINPLLYCYSALIIFLCIPGAGRKKHFAVIANTIIRIVLAKRDALSWLSARPCCRNYRCFLDFIIIKVQITFWWWKPSLLSLA